MKQQLLCMQTWRPVNLLCSARHAGSEVTFLCACPTDCSGGGGGNFQDSETERRLAAGWPAAISHLRSILACQSRQRDSRRGPLKPSKARGCLYLSACEPTVVSGSD